MQIIELFYDITNINKLTFGSANFIRTLSNDIKDKIIFDKNISLLNIVYMTNNSNISSYLSFLILSCLYNDFDFNPNSIFINCKVKNDIDDCDCVVLKFTTFSEINLGGLV